MIDTDRTVYEVTVEQEIADTSCKRPHVVLLGAGASKAALPRGDRHGRPVPVLKELADQLGLVEVFPDELRDLARTNFEAAYSRLFDLGSPLLDEINDRLYRYFSELELPNEPNLYDVLTLCLRDKDAIFTFNWDPFLMLARVRLARLGVTTSFPMLFFLHGNVLAGYCRQDRNSGLLGRTCSMCGQAFVGSQLVFPVEKKNYQDGGLVERDWEAARVYLHDCFMLTVFGYSAPATDVEAVVLLKEGWGDPKIRQLEQTEIIDIIPEAELAKKWAPFIHTHHYETHQSLYDSWLVKHPRRTCEAWWNQYLEAKFISDNQVPDHFDGFEAMVTWFTPLLEAE